MAENKSKYALINGELYAYEGTVRHAVKPDHAIVICTSNGNERYVAQQEWNEAAAAFTEDAAQKGIVTTASPAKDKLRLFRSLFLGREDVYAHGYRRKNGGIGYSPACQNEWLQGVCPRTTGSLARCAQCAQRSFKQLEDKTIIEHFKGSDPRLRDVIGQYVLDRDCKTRVLVMDFDKKDWKQAVTAIRKTAAEHELDSSLERSRSGNGGHIWFFFDKPIEARLARTFGATLIADAATSNKTISFDAYDRMLPAQSTIPEGGFGNLIALPFQGQAQCIGNSVFVDDDFMPHADQWLYLSQINKITENQIKALFSSSSNAARASAGFKAAQFKEPQLPWGRQKSHPLTQRDFPPRLGVTESDMLYIPEKALSQPAQAAIKRLAAFANPEFFRAQAMHQSVYGKPRVVYFGESRDDCIAIPRGCKHGLCELTAKANVPIDFIDRRYHGAQINVSFNGKLRPDQIEAADAMLCHDNGILAAPTGFGKTIVAAYIAAQLKVSTLIIVPKTVLIAQWKKQLEDFLDIIDTRKPRLTPKGNVSKKQLPLIGQFGGGKTKPSGIIDIATFQSLTTRDPDTAIPHVAEIVNEYGLIICDECHHAAAPQLELVLKSARAKHVYGLSATPKRSDGLTKALFMLCGPVRHTVDPKAQASRQGIKRVFRPRFTNFAVESVDPNASYNQVLDHLCGSEARNGLIVKDIEGALIQGKWPLVLTKRRKHAELLCEKLQTGGCKAKLLVGGGSAKERKAALASLEEEKTGRYAIVATESFLGEGFDLSRLDTLFLATPISWDGNVTQQAGRLHRQYEGKTEVELFDYIDMNVSMLARMYKKRLKTYACLGYEVRLSEASEPDEPNALVTAKEAMGQLANDIDNAKQTITIAASYASEKTVLQLQSHLADALARGVNVNVSLPPTQNETGIEVLAKLGIKPTLANNARHSFVIFDKQLVWFGALPLLAFPKQDDCSIRFRDDTVARELVGLIK